MVFAPFLEDIFTKVNIMFDNSGKIDFCSSLRANVKQSDKTGATHVAPPFYNVSENCHPELDSGSINADLRLRNKCAMTCVGKKILSLGGELERG